MKNVLRILLVLFAYSSAAEAQQCRVYFTVQESDPHFQVEAWPR